MATTLKRIGAGLLMVGMALTMAAGVLHETDFFLRVVVLSLPLLAVGALLFWRGRQYEARATAATVISDSRPDVLYLRDFRADASTLKHVWSALVTRAAFTGMATEEEQFAEAMQPLGDLVAIGRPGESLPTPGAARMYASDQEWRDVVSRQMQNARLVVIRAGSGEGLLWELRRAFELVPPQKLLFLVLNMKREHYLYFRQTVSAVFGVSLPQPEALTRFGKLSGFIAFSADWTPSILPLKTPSYFARGTHKPLRTMFEQGLQPVFKAAGVESPPRPMLARWMFTLQLAAVATIVMVIALYATREDHPWLDDPEEMHTHRVEDPYAAAAGRPQQRPEALDGPEQTPASSHPDEASMVEYRLHGFRRLGDEWLVQRAAVMARILEEADTETCAAIARGDAAPGIVFALRRLSPEERHQYAEVVYQATAAERHNAPVPGRPPAFAIEWSFRELFETLSPEDANLLWAFLHNRRAGTSEEACRAGQLLYGNLMLLPEQPRATLAREIVWM